MNSKDTVTSACKLCSSAENQAEISFKAGKREGITLFAYWKDGVQYVGHSSVITLKRALEEEQW